MDNRHKIHRCQENQIAAYLINIDGCAGNLHGDGDQSSPDIVTDFGNIADRH